MAPGLKALVLRERLGEGLCCDGEATALIVGTPAEDPAAPLAVAPAPVPTPARRLLLDSLSVLGPEAHPRCDTATARKQTSAAKTGIRTRSCVDFFM